MSKIASDYKNNSKNVIENPHVMSIISCAIREWLFDKNIIRKEIFKSSYDILDFYALNLLIY